MIKKYNYNITTSKSDKEIFKKLIEGNVSSLILPANITRIGRGVFSYSTLTNLTIQNSIKTIEDEAFQYSSLQKITFNGTIEEWNNVSKWPDWKAKSNIKTIICNDGNVSV